MAIIGMNHFTVLTDDLARTRAFYVDMLGLGEGHPGDSLDGGLIRGGRADGGQMPEPWVCARRAPVGHAEDA